MALTSPDDPQFPLAARAGGPVRVLLVDVHPVVRSGVAAVLAGAGGFEVVGATGDWRETLELAHARQPDVVLLDLSITTASEASSSVVALLRALPGAPAVLLFTTLADQKGLQAARAAGATAYVLKDVAPAELITALRRAVADSHSPVVTVGGGDLDEPELVHRAVDGDPSAWEQLYRRAHPKLLAFARRRLSPDQAADAVADTFLRALTDLDRFDRRPGRFEPWLFGIARHVIADAHRASARRLRLVRSDGPVPPAGPLESVLDGEEALAARRAFERLSPADQELLELRIIAGLSTDDVATVLGKQAGSVRMAQSRAIARLRAEMQQEHGAHAG
jgi:RNA polymerase sigma-70 factor (ECF subfamily)